MAGFLNEVNLMGNLGRDPEVHTTASGDRIVNLSIATTKSWKDRGGERKERTEWHRVVIFSNGLADVAEKYLQKGSKVLVRGALQTRKWTDNADVERYSTEVVLQPYDGKLIMLDSSPDRSSPSTAGSSTPASGAKRPDTNLEDEIPF